MTGRKRRGPERQGKERQKKRKRADRTASYERKQDSFPCVIDGSELYRHCIRGCPDHENFLVNIAETPITTRATTTHAALLTEWLSLLTFSFTCGSHAGRRPAHHPRGCNRQHGRTGRGGKRQQRTDVRTRTDARWRPQPCPGRRSGQPASW